MMIRTSKRGFTLIETMVAISLLAIALIGPFVAVREALQASYVARDELVASQLAQEGVEYIRSIRDNNFLNGRSWVYGFSDSVRNDCYGASPSGYCTVDPTLGDFNISANGMVEYVSTSTAKALYISSAGLYNQRDIGNPTRFKRLVRVYTVSATEIRVVVWVVWMTGPNAYTMTVTDNLQDWI